MSKKSKSIPAFATMQDNPSVTGRSVHLDVVSPGDFLGRRPGLRIEHSRNLQEFMRLDMLSCNISSDFSGLPIMTVFLAESGPRTDVYLKVGKATAVRFPEGETQSKNFTFTKVRMPKDTVTIPISAYIRLETGEYGPDMAGMDGVTFDDRFSSAPIEDKPENVSNPALEAELKEANEQPAVDAKAKKSSDRRKKSSKIDKLQKAADAKAKKAGKRLAKSKAKRVA